MRTEFIYIHHAREKYNGRQNSRIKNEAKGEDIFDQNQEVKGKDKKLLRRVLFKIRVLLVPKGSFVFLRA